MTLKWCCWWWWWCSLYSGWLWSHVYARSTWCVTMATHHLSRRWMIQGRRPSSLIALVPPPSLLPLAHIPRFTRHLVATSTRRRPPARTTVVRPSRVMWPTTVLAKLAIPVTGRTRPGSLFHHATDHRSFLYHLRTRGHLGDNRYKPYSTVEF